MPSLGLVRYTPLTTTTSAVSRQMTTVSRNGSINAAKPCDMGSLVRTVACAIGADPRPASFANDARRKPWISAPIAPPATACGTNASRRMVASAAGMCVKFAPSTTRHATTYSRHMNGESLSVHLTMRRTPPNSTMPIHTAMMRPKTKACSKSVTARNCTYAWFTWKMVSEPPTAATQKNPARNFPRRGSPDALERDGHVVHRAAAHRAVRANQPVFHRERDLGELGAHAEKPGDDHPERRARTAERDRHRDAADGAESHRARDRGRERLERRRLAGMIAARVVAADHLRGMPEATQVHEAERERADDAARNEPHEDERELRSADRHGEEDDLAEPVGHRRQPCIDGLVEIHWWQIMVHSMLRIGQYSRRNRPNTCASQLPRSFRCSLLRRGATAPNLFAGGWRDEVVR